jgi:hypothetical protein
MEILSLAMARLASALHGIEDDPLNAISCHSQEILKGQNMLRGSYSTGIDSALADNGLEKQEIVEKIIELEDVRESQQESGSSRERLTRIMRLFRCL